MQRVADREPRAEAVERVLTQEIEVAAREAFGEPPVRPAGEREFGG